MEVLGKIGDKFWEWKNNFRDSKEDHVNFRGSLLGGKEEVDPHTQPTFDPMLGFPNGRQVREPHVTLQEIDDHRVPMLFRDYCAHKYIEMKKCYNETPAWRRGFLGECHHSFHEHASCQNDQVVLQMKEYERERRLRARQKRRIEMGLEEDPNAATE